MINTCFPCGFHLLLPRRPIVEERTIEKTTAPKAVSAILEVEAVDSA